MNSTDDLILVEVLTASDCGHCQRARTLARETIAELGIPGIRYREINVVEEIDYAVQLGVLSTPAIAINGELVFAALPSKCQLQRAILGRQKNHPGLQPLSGGQ